MKNPKPLRFVIKRHATLPYLELLVYNSEGAPFNFTGALEVKFSMKNEEGDLVIDSAAAEIADSNPTLGKLRYRWIGTDTSTPGNYSAEFDVVYTGSRLLTLPLDGDIRVKIYEDINNG